MSGWLLRHKSELLIDLDDYMRPAPSRTGESKGPYGEMFFRRRLGDAMRAGKLEVRSVYLDHSSTAKHWHAVVRLKYPMNDIEALCWQLRLGSDIMRGQADLMRAARGIDAPSLLIRSKPIKDFYRAFDFECPCTRKHDTHEQFELALDGQACAIWLQFRGMTPWELFGPTTPGKQRGVRLPCGRVPLNLITAIRGEHEPPPEPEPMEPERIDGETFGTWEAGEFEEDSPESEYSDEDYDYTREEIEAAIRRTMEDSK